MSLETHIPRMPDDYWVMVWGESLRDPDKRSISDVCFSQGPLFSADTLCDEHDEGERDERTTDQVEGAGAGLNLDLEDETKDRDGDGGENDEPAKPGIVALLPEG